MYLGSNQDKIKRMKINELEDKGLRVIEGWSFQLLMLFSVCPCMEPTPKALGRFICLVLRFTCPRFVVFRSAEKTGRLMNICVFTILDHNYYTASTSL